MIIIYRFRLLFCDNDNTTILATNGKLQYYEYADPDFTHKEKT
jgi:hypothetical protein